MAFSSLENTPDFEVCRWSQGHRPALKTGLGDSWYYQQNYEDGGRIARNCARKDSCLSQQNCQSPCEGETLAPELGTKTTTIHVAGQRCSTDSLPQTFNTAMTIPSSA